MTPCGRGRRIRLGPASPRILVRAWQYLQCWRLEPAVRAPVCGLSAAPRESSLLCLSWSLLPPCGPGRHRRRGMLPALLLASLGGAAEEFFWKPPGAVAIFSVRVWRMLQRIGVLTRGSAGRKRGGCCSGRPPTGRLGGRACEMAARCRKVLAGSLGSPLGRGRARNAAGAMAGSACYAPDLLRLHLVRSLRHASRLPPERWIALLRHGPFGLHFVPAKGAFPRRS